MLKPRRQQSIKNMKNVYLIGMMGSGKTTTGRELARLLSISFVDLDRLIEERAGKSINEIFTKDGEPHFRRLEAEVLKRVVQSADQVVATGGGSVLDQSNCNLMKRTGIILYLKASLEALWERVKNMRSRPLLNTDNPKASLAKCLYDRELIYQEVAQHTFFTDGMSPEAAALQIYRRYFKAS